MFEKQDKVECIFVGIYFLEQVSLILAYNFLNSYLPLWIGLFPVIFLTTIAFEKVFMKSDFKDQQESLIEMLRENTHEEDRNKEFKLIKNTYLGGKKWKQA